METTADELAPASEPATARGYFAAGWGIFAIAALLVQALARLIPIALEPLRNEQLSAAQLALYIGWVVFTAYTEGYRGFQKSFSPRCSARAVKLAQSPTLLRSILAPAYCMSLFAAPRRKLIASWCLLIGITTLVILVKLLPQPWRGIVDGGVVVGLFWGLLSLLASTYSAFRSLGRSSIRTGV